MQKKQPKFSKFIDGNQINHVFRLNHVNLDMAFKKLKQIIDEEFDNFKNYVMGGLNNLNFIRYMETYPQDDIKFIFKESTHASISEQRLNQKTQILKKMADFQVISQDYAGVAENCLFEINEMIEKNQKILKFKQICPSGETFMKRYKSTLDGYVSVWRNFGNEVMVENVFKDASPTFPKQELKRIGSILSQANKSVITAKLLFRASEHNFQSTAFKEICAGHGNTLLIAKSQKGNIFGAFTPCKWLNTKQKQFVGDAKGESFLFSADRGMIFPLKRNQQDYAISAYGGWGPIYGSPYGPDLSISDKCNLNDHSCSSLGSHYEIPIEIKEYSNEAFSLLAGGKKFKVVEYEVYELVTK